MENIQFHNEDIPEINVNEPKLTSAIQYIIKSEHKICGEINIIFCSDEYLLHMNREHLEHDYYTDIITFDYVEENTINGDLFISVDRISENAGKFAVEFTEELKRVVYHGILHLVGFNDKTEGQRREMREKENYYLQMVK